MEYTLETSKDHEASKGHFLNECQGCYAKVLSKEDLLKVIKNDKEALVVIHHYNLGIDGFTYISKRGKRYVVIPSATVNSDEAVG
jgi:hypothetical protein